MVHGIGDGGLTPEQKKVLNDEYKQAAKGFQAALDKFSTLDSAAQKNECKNVMQEYMSVMDHAAADLGRKGMLSQTTKLEADLKALDSDSTATQKLKMDLNNLLGGK